MHALSAHSQQRAPVWHHAIHIVWTPSALAALPRAAAPAHTCMSMAAQITVGLLQQALQQQQRGRSNAGKPSTFVIDGFPRNVDNLHAWEETAPQNIALVVELTAPQAQLRHRLLARQDQRSDDTHDVITKRFQVGAQQGNARHQRVHGPRAATLSVQLLPGPISTCRGALNASRMP